MGRVERVADGIAVVSGLPAVRLDELVRFERGQVGFAMTLDRDSLGCVLLDDPQAIEAGDLVHGTGEVVRCRSGRASSAAPSIRSAARSIGRRDRRRRLRARRASGTGHHRSRFRQRAGADRLLVINSMFALGRGQRELIIGDRAIGKTAIAVDCIINQKSSDIICVYVAVGQNRPPSSG